MTPTSTGVSSGAAGANSLTGIGQMHTSGYVQVMPKQNACPHCGYCPHCGRSNSYPSWPYYQYPTFTYCGTASAAGPSSL